MSKDDKSNIDKKTLINAIDQGDVEQAKALMEKPGRNLNYQDRNGVSALMKAAAKGKVDIVEKLIAGGARINAKDKDGKTPLMYAAEAQNTELVEKLIAAGADINVADKQGNTPFTYANSHNEICAAINKRSREQIEPNKRLFRFANRGNMYEVRGSREEGEDSLDKIIQEGADVNAKDKAGITPLMYAALARNLERVEALIAHGAEIQARDLYGRTAAQKAQKMGYEEIAQLLTDSVGNLLTMRNTRNLDDLHSTNKLGGGVSDSKIYEDQILDPAALTEKGLSPKLIVKSTDKKDAREGNFEFIVSRLYERILPGKSPIYGLTSRAGSDKQSKPLITGQFIEGYIDLDSLDRGTPRKPSEKIHLENLEKVLTASVFGGEADAHWGNIGAKIEKVWKMNNQGILEEIEQYSAAKIDHGRSGYIMASNISELTSSLANMATTRYKYDKTFHLSPEKFAESIKEIAQISEDEIENLLYSRIGELNKANGTTYGDKSLSYIEFKPVNSDKRLTSDEQKIANNKTKELGKAKNARAKNPADILVSQFKTHAKLFRELDANIELMRKMEKDGRPLELDKMDLREFFEAAKDPVLWAIDKGYTIEKQNPLQYAIDKAIKIEGLDPIVYYSTNNLQIENLHPVAYALKHNIAISSKAQEYIKENIDKDEQLKKALRYLDWTRSPRNFARYIQKRLGLQTRTANIPIYQEGLLKKFQSQQNIAR